MENRRGYEFVSALTPRQDSNTKVREKQASGAGIVLIAHPDEVIPNDSILVKRVIPFPFRETDLVHAVLDTLSEREANKVRDTLAPSVEGGDAQAFLESLGVAEGKAYAFLREDRETVRKVSGTLAASGARVFLVSSARPKVAKERMGLDRDAVVFNLSGSRYPLGSVVESVRDFVSKNPGAVIEFDDIDDVVNHCGLDRTLRMLSTLLSEGGFTFLMSVNGRLLSPAVRDMIGGLMGIIE